MNCKPVVGINADYRSSNDRRFKAGWTAICSTYYDALAGSGSTPVIFPPLENLDDHPALIDLVDAVVFCGGDDLDPRNDGFMLHPSVRLLHERRERFDRALMCMAIQRQLPMLAIGCGMQLLNVSQGGNLFLHLPEDMPRALPHADATDSAHSHGLDVEPRSFLHRVFGLGCDLRVTSQHHMAIDEVAPGFRVTARSPDRVIEAIESTDDEWFAVGIQFHPESEYAFKFGDLLFAAFVSEVVRIRGQRSSAGRGADAKIYHGAH